MIEDMHFFNLTYFVHVAKNEAIYDLDLSPSDVTISSPLIMVAKQLLIGRSPTGANNSCGSLMIVAYGCIWLLTSIDPINSCHSPLGTILVAVDQSLAGVYLKQTCNQMGNSWSSWMFLVFSVPGSIQNVGRKKRVTASASKPQCSHCVQGPSPDKVFAEVQSLDVWSH